jgi:hypothetical protein
MRRKALIEMLAEVEIMRCEIAGKITYRISGKSCEDVADFVQEELLREKDHRQYEKGKK